MIVTTCHRCDGQLAISDELEEQLTRDFGSVPRTLAHDVCPRDTSDLRVFSAELIVRAAAPPLNAPDDDEAIVAWVTSSVERPSFAAAEEHLLHGLGSKWLPIRSAAEIIDAGLQDPDDPITHGPQWRFSLTVDLDGVVTARQTGDAPSNVRASIARKLRETADGLEALDAEADATGLTDEDVPPPARGSSS